MFNSQVNKTQQCEKRQYTKVTFPVKRIGRNCAFFYSRVISTTQREAAYNHEQQREVSEEGYQIFCDIID